MYIQRLHSVRHIYFETVDKEYWWMCLSCDRYVQCLSWTYSIHKKCIKYLKRNNGGKKSQHQWRCWGACHLDKKISWLDGGNFQSQMLLYGPLALVVLRMLQWQLLDEKPKTNNDGCIECLFYTNYLSMQIIIPNYNR